MKKLITVLLAGLFGFNLQAAAQEQTTEVRVTKEPEQATAMPISLRKLPMAMDGEWTLVSIRGQKFDGPIKVTTQEDGTGTFTFVGLRCQANGVPMKWTSDETNVTFTGSLGLCGEGTFVMRRGAIHFLEGTGETTYNRSLVTITVYLDPAKTP